jgi:CRP-like cAMP-binding protein
MNCTRLELDLLVAKVPLFKGMLPEQVQMALQVGRVVEYAHGKVLCRDGDSSDHMYILLVGSLQVRSGEVLLSLIEAVDVVGEMGMITDMPRSATVEVATAARLIRIEKSDFDTLLDHNPALAAGLFRNMLQLLSQRLRDNNINLVKTRLLAGMDTTSTWI